jgi:hypothetical protein
MPTKKNSLSCVDNEVMKNNNKINNKHFEYQASRVVSNINKPN